MSMPLDLRLNLMNLLSPTRRPTMSVRFLSVTKLAQGEALLKSLSGNVLMPGLEPRFARH